MFYQQQKKKWPHKKNVVNKVQDLGMEVIYIPGGCMGLCWSVDVGFNKAFKTQVWRLLDEWMVEEWEHIMAQDETLTPHCVTV